VTTRPPAATGTVPAAATLVGRAEDRRALWVMTVAHGIQHFYVAGLAVTYPFVLADFHVSYGLLGVVLTVAGVAGGLLQASAGLVRRASARFVLTAQNIGMAVATFGGAASPGFSAFSGARVMGAVVSWPQHPVGSAYLSDRFPDRRATVLSWHTAGGSAGTVAVPLLASAVIGAAGWRWALVTLGAVLLVGAVLVLVALPAERRSAATVADGAGAPTLPLRRLLTLRRVVAVLGASTIAAGGRGLGTLTTYIPAYLRTGLHLSALTVGGVFTVVMAASIAGPVLGGMLGDRFGRARTLVITYLAAAVAIAGFGWSATTWSLSAWSACASACWPMPSLRCCRRCTRISPSRQKRGRRSGRSSPSPTGWAHCGASRSGPSSTPPASAPPLPSWPARS